VNAGTRRLIPRRVGGLGEPQTAALKEAGSVGVRFVNAIAPATPRLTLSTAWVRNVNRHPSRIVTLTLCTPQAVHFSPLRRAHEIVGEKRTVWVPNSPTAEDSREIGDKCTLTGAPPHPLPLPSAVDVRPPALARRRITAY